MAGLVPTLPLRMAPARLGGMRGSSPRMTKRRYDMPHPSRGAIAPGVWVIPAPERMRARGTPGSQGTRGPRRLAAPRLAEVYLEPPVRRSPGVPRAVFEACSAPTPEDRRPCCGHPLDILRWWSAAGGPDQRSLGRGPGVYVRHPETRHRSPPRVSWRWSDAPPWSGIYRI